MTRIALDIKCKSTHCGFCKYLISYIHHTYECHLFGDYRLETSNRLPLRCIPCLNAERLELNLPLLEEKQDIEIPF